jgi:hypothetical protein
MEPNKNPYASPGAGQQDDTTLVGGRAGRFLSPQKRAGRTILLFYVAMFLLLLELAFHGGLVFFLLRSESGVNINATEAQGMAIADLSLRLLHLVVRVALFWTFLLWFRRAYRNLPALGADDLSASATEAVLSFFVPVVNLFRPYQLTKEIWRGSDLSALDPEQKVVFSSALVGYWWTFLWISVVLRIIAWFANRYTGQAGNTLVAGEAIVAIWFSIGATLMQMIAALLGLHVVKTITTNQEEKWKRLEVTGEKEVRSEE